MNSHWWCPITSHSQCLFKSWEHLTLKSAYLITLCLAWRRFISSLNEARGVLVLYKMLRATAKTLRNLCWINIFLYRRLLKSCFATKDEIKGPITLISMCLPSFSTEVFASQPGSVESLRKVNDLPGNSQQSAYRNLNQHCSACARVKHLTLCQAWPSTQFLSMPAFFQIDCVL